MTKTEVQKISKTLVLPKGWKVQRVFGAHKYGKPLGEYPMDEIILGCPIGERMSSKARALNKKIDAVVKQLNKGRKRGEPKWDEIGSGYGGGLWYDIDIVREYPAE